MPTLNEVQKDERRIYGLRIHSRLPFPIRPHSVTGHTLGTAERSGKALKRVTVSPGRDTVTRGAAGQAAAVTSTLRGLARSATGMLRVSTPLS
jgi:hypothetical protein